MKSFIYIFIFLSINTLHALEVDEKLTLRFLKVSSTKKTVLVNRGAEDGLVVGNHAKFFVTSGVIARGVVEKVSPSRSIWSLYRVIDPNEITDNKVLNLKIGTPVKISEDASKSLKDEITPSGREKIKISKTKMNKEELLDVDAYEADNDDALSTIPVAKQNSKMEMSSFGPRENQWEVWSNVSANMLSGNAENINIGTVSATTTSRSSSHDITLGVEKYFFQTKSFLSSISFIGFLHKRSASLGQDIQIQEDLFEFGAGIHYHFTPTTYATHTLIPFGLFDFGIGNITLTNTVSGSTTTSEPSIKGTSKFISFGGGVKYVLNNGFGFRGIIDYYSSSESYAYASSTGTRSLAGLRLQAGLSYRF